MLSFLKQKKENKKSPLLPPYSYVNADILKAYRNMMKTMEKKGVNGFTNREFVGNVS